ncbi:MAG: hypothetical protein ACK559_30130, partial [bacterium]
GASEARYFACSPGHQGAVLRRWHSKVSTSCPSSQPSMSQPPIWMVSSDSISCTAEMKIACGLAAWIARCIRRTQSAICR